MKRKQERLERSLSGKKYLAHVKKRDEARSRKNRIYRERRIVGKVSDEFAKEGV